MKRVHYIFLITLILSSCESSISEFQSKNFIKYFGSGYESKGNDIVELSDGGYLLVGYDLVDNSDYQVYACRVDAEGNTVWSNVYGSDSTKDEGTVVRNIADGFAIASTSTEESGLIHSYITKINLQGEVLWSQSVGESTFDITINDFTVDGSNIYLAGSSDALSANKTDYFISKLDEQGNKIWDKYFQTSMNSSFQKIFLYNDELLLVGTDGSTSKTSVFLIPQSHFGINSAVNIGEDNETPADAVFSDNQLYVLLNKGTSASVLENINSSLSETWRSDNISGIIGKSVTLKNDGSLILCGENTLSGSSYINFIKVDNGGAYSGNDALRPFQGSVGKVIKTNDSGLIMVGATGSTFGKSIQLIKTDKDYFMLKN